MADTELLLGVAGITGTLIASSTGYVSAVWVERRRQARDDRQARGEMRTAARLVMDEIARNTASAGQAEPASDGLVRVFIPFEHASWQQYAHVLATIDDRQAWTEVAAAYAAFYRVATNDHTTDASFIPTLQQQAGKALDALRPHG